MPFIGKQSTSNSQITNYTTTVGSGGQTNFTVVIEGGDETHVYLNGVLLKETTDYTVSSTQVSLVSPAVENDIVEIKVFRSFALVDAVRASDGGTFSGDVTVPNLIIGDGGTIGSASDTDAIAIASDGGLTFNGGIDNAGTISAGTFNGTIGTSASSSANLPAVKTALNASGSAPIYACRAWVNFNGTGTVAIRDSGNVSSITDNATGDYTVNFTTAMPDDDYASFCAAGLRPGLARFYGLQETQDSSTYRFKTYRNDDVVDDSLHTFVAIFR